MQQGAAAEARLRRTRRIAELVWHLTEIEPHDVLDVVESTDTRIEFTHDAAVCAAARAMTVLAATAPRYPRTPGYMRRGELVRATAIAHHTSLRRWERTAAPDERAREFARQEIADLRKAIIATAG